MDPMTTGCGQWEEHGTSPLGQGMWGRGSHSGLEVGRMSLGMSVAPEVCGRAEPVGADPGDATVPGLQST